MKEFYPDRINPDQQRISLIGQKPELSISLLNVTAQLEFNGSMKIVNACRYSLCLICDPVKAIGIVKLVILAWEGELCAT